MKAPKMFVVILIIVFITLLGIALPIVWHAANTAGYNKGFSDGYSSGEKNSSIDDASYSIGYDAGYNDALVAFGLNPDNISNSKEESWPYLELMNAWIEVGGYIYENPCELYVTEDSISLFYGENVSSFGYTLPEIVYTQERPEKEVYLELEDCKEFIHLIFHEERIDDDTIIPILSATIAELDGRGEIIIAEFARFDDAHLVPSFFRSSFLVRQDEQDSPPMEKP